MEELKKLKAQKNIKNQENQGEDQESLPKLKADILPPVMMQRKGQFEMIPDFLKQSDVKRDMFSLQEQDLMANAFRKQDDSNNSGPSMSELFAQKRMETEKALANKKPGAPSTTEIEDRKARLLAQRDALRKAKEEKRKEELEEFKAKTETKEDLFAELKKMD